MTRVIDRPEPMYAMARLVKGGPLVPVAIMRIETTEEPNEPGNLMERSPFLAAFAAGEVTDLESVWHRKGEPISADEYAYQLALLAHYRRHEPDHPLANPRRPIKAAAIRSLF